MSLAEIHNHHHIYEEPPEVEIIGPAGVPGAVVKVNGQVVPGIRAVHFSAQSEDPYYDVRLFIATDKLTITSLPT